MRAAQSILQRKTGVSCRGYAVSRKRAAMAVNQGGTADIVVRPWQKSSFVTGVFLFA